MSLLGLVAFGCC